MEIQVEMLIKDLRVSTEYIGHQILSTKEITLGGTRREQGEVCLWIGKHRQQVCLLQWFLRRKGESLCKGELVSPDWAG